jgi:hypothetical protein
MSELLNSRTEEISELLNSTKKTPKLGRLSSESAILNPILDTQMEIFVSGHLGNSVLQYIICGLLSRELGALRWAGQACRDAGRRAPLRGVAIRLPIPVLVPTRALAHHRRLLVQTAFPAKNSGAILSGQAAGRSVACQK